MKLFKLLFKSLFIVIISMIIITGCSQPEASTNTIVKEQNNGTNQDPNDINVLVNEIKSMGFDTSNYIISNGRIIVEGDIGFNIEDLKNQISHESKSSSGPMKQYRHIYAASPQYTSNIKIRLSYELDNYSYYYYIIKSAIADWNNTGTTVHFSFVQDNREISDIYISMVSDIKTQYTICQATPPRSGSDRVGDKILINKYALYNYQSTLTASQLENNIVHAFGHCLGLRHVNKSESDRLIIPDTPKTDIYSFMVDDQFKSWSGFSYWDLVSIRYLFDNSTPYIILYQDTNYFGQRFLVRSNMLTLWANGEGFNDMASSVKVFNGARAILFQDSYYGGDPCYVEWDVPSLGAYSNFNDTASSVLFY